MTFAALFLLWSALPWLAASTFSFTSDAPTECDNLNISWTGGSGDGYYLSILPVFDVPRNISIPTSAFNNGQGSFSTVLPFNVTDKIVLTMSDSTGFGAGGSSEILTVGKSLGGSCNTSSPGVAFSFILAQALQQCLPYEFSGYIESGAITPVTIMGVIPGGDSFVLHPPTGPKTFDWTVNVYNGTEIIFLMIDANFRQGGSFLNTVALSGDSSCINATSPSSTIDLSATSTSSASPSASSGVPSTPTSSIGAIAGSVLGALIFLAVLITLGLFFLRQRQEKKNARMAGGSEFRRNSRPLVGSELDLTYDAHQNVSNSRPYMSSSIPASSVSQLFSGRDEHAPFQGGSHPPVHYQPHSPYLTSRLPESENPFAAAPSLINNNTDVDPFMERGSGSDGISAGQRKSGMSGFSGYKPSRYVVHTDAEDDLPANEDGVVELPPQYSATRGPPKALPHFSSPPL
ncbi:hypothetical protein C8R44DRAFT_816241 [Mycena epipterygia]|nr:hypothetical protein C8R44DRAFT_816241 [Mycena epipterygia]